MLPDHSAQKSAVLHGLPLLMLTRIFFLPVLFIFGNGSFRVQFLVKKT